MAGQIAKKWLLNPFNPNIKIESPLYSYPNTFAVELIVRSYQEPASEVIKISINEIRLM